MFHVFMPRKRTIDPDAIVELLELEFFYDATYVVRHMAIMERDTKKIRHTTIEMVKVWWCEDPSNAT